MKRPPPKRGLFLTFEGGEGAGKTTLMKELARQLTSEGYTVLSTREPGGTELGEKIRTLLLQGGGLSPYAELSLFLASRAQHIAEVIGPSLERGEIVLCDRFNDSSIAYQGVGRGLGVEEVAHFCHFISQGLSPHLTFYLDLSPELGLQRAQARASSDRIEAEALPFHLQIREAYLQLQRKEPHRIRLLDASLSPAQVYSAAMDQIHPLLLR